MYLLGIFPLNRGVEPLEKPRNLKPKNLNTEKPKNLIKKGR